MQFLWMALLNLALLTGGWQTDFEKATDLAKKEHKLILLNFSGSDWCGPCIRMHKEIFDNSTFVQYADEHLVLVNADFPRLKKNQLAPEHLKKNNRLAELYNKEGDFPLTLLLTEDGKVLKTWQGFPQVSPAAFVDQLKEAANAHN